MTDGRDDDRFTEEERRALAAWGTEDPPPELALRAVARAQAADAAAPGGLPAIGSGADGRRARARRRRRRAWAAALGALGLSGGALAFGVASAQSSAGTLLSVYLGCLVFGGILLVASLVGGHGEEGADHAGEAHAHDGGPEHAHGHEHSAHANGRAPGYLPLLSIRFWIFTLTFFGLTGVLLQGLALASPVVGALLAAAVGVGAGYGASRAFQSLMRDTVGALEGPEAHVGREGTLLLPVAPGQRGKVRFAAHGGQVDLVAETDGAESLPVGTTVLIVGMRGTTAIVERSVAARDGRARSEQEGTSP